MNIQDAQKYLQLLGQALQKKEVTGEILVNDDIMLLLDIRKPEEPDRDAYIAYLKGENPLFERHEDIDDYFEGHGTVIREAIAHIAYCEHLASNWLHDALKALFSPETQQKWLEYPGLRVYLAPMDYMLAMKVATDSYSQDIQDVKILAKKLHISNAQEMLVLITKYIPEQLLTPGVRLFIEQCFVS